MTKAFLPNAVAREASIASSKHDNGSLESLVLLQRERVATAFMLKIKHRKVGVTPTKQTRHGRSGHFLNFRDGEACFYHPYLLASKPKLYIVLKPSLCMWYVAQIDSFLKPGITVAWKQAQMGEGVKGGI